MKKLAFLFTALLLLASCSNGYKLNVTFLTTATTARPSS